MKGRIRDGKFQWDGPEDRSTEINLIPVPHPDFSAAWRQLDEAILAIFGASGDRADR